MPGPPAWRTLLSTFPARGHAPRRQHQQPNPTRCRHHRRRRAQPLIPLPWRRQRRPPAATTCASARQSTSKRFVYSISTATTNAWWAAAPPPSRRAAARIMRPLHCRLTKNLNQCPPTLLQPDPYPPHIPQQLAQFLQAQVLPALGPPASPAGGRRMLDVGAGDASLAARLLPLFPGGVLAVDCNAALLLGEDHDGSSGSSISGSSSSGPPASDPPAGAGTSGGRAPAPAAGAITKIVADFLQLGLPEGERYDLVLASHVLYQVGPSLQRHDCSAQVVDPAPPMWHPRCRLRCSLPSASTHLHMLRHVPSLWRLPPQMPPAVIAAFIQKMRSHCAPGGRVLVALGAPRGNLYAFEQGKSELRKEAGCGHAMPPARGFQQALRRHGACASTLPAPQPSAPPLHPACRAAALHGNQR